jgi:hypothetical protein
LLLSLDLSFTFPMMPAESEANPNHQAQSNPAEVAQLEEQLQRQVRVGDVLCCLLHDAVEAVAVRGTASTLPLSLRSLRGLNLEASGLSDSGIMKLIAAAKHCPADLLPSLQWLSFAHNFLSFDGCMAVVRVCLHSETFALAKNLQALHLGGNVLASSEPELDALSTAARNETLSRNEELQHCHGVNLLQIFVGKFNGQPMTIDQYIQMRSAKVNSPAAKKASKKNEAVDLPKKKESSSTLSPGVLLATPTKRIPPSSGSSLTPSRGLAAATLGPPSVPSTPSVPASSYLHHANDSFLSPILPQGPYHHSSSNLEHHQEALQAVVGSSQRQAARSSYHAHIQREAASTLAKPLEDFNGSNASVLSTSTDPLNISPSRRRPRRVPLLSPSAVEDDADEGPKEGLFVLEEELASRQRSAVLFEGAEAVEEATRQHATDSPSGLVDTPRIHQKNPDSAKQKNTAGPEEKNRDVCAQAPLPGSELGTGTATDDGTETVASSTCGSVITTASDKIAARKARLAATKAKRTAKKLLLPEDEMPQEATSDQAVLEAHLQTHQEAHQQTSIVAAEPTNSDEASASVASEQRKQSWRYKPAAVAADEVPQEPPQSTEVAHESIPQHVAEDNVTIITSTQSAAVKSTGNSHVTRIRIPREASQLSGRIRTFSLTYAHPPGHIFCRHWSALKLPNVVEMIQEDVLDFLQPDDEDLSHTVDKVIMEIDGGMGLTTFTVTTNLKRATVADSLQRHANDMEDPSIPFPRFFHFVKVSLQTMTQEDRLARVDLVEVVRKRMLDLGPLSKLNESFPSVETLVHEYHGNEESLLKELGCEDILADQQHILASTGEQAERNDTPNSESTCLESAQQTLVFSPSSSLPAEGVLEVPKERSPLCDDQPAVGSHANGPLSEALAFSPRSDAAVVADDIAVSEATASPERPASPGSTFPAAQKFLIVAESLPWTLPDGDALEAHENGRRSDVFCKWNGPVISAASLTDTSSCLARGTQSVTLFLEDPLRGMCKPGGENDRGRTQSRSGDVTSIPSSAHPTPSKASVTMPADSSTPQNQAADASPAIVATAQSSVTRRSADPGGESPLHRQASFTELVEQRLSQSGDKYAFLSSHTVSTRPSANGEGGGTATGRRGQSVSLHRSKSPIASEEQRKLLLRMRNIQRLCYDSMRSGDIQLSQNSRNKVPVCKGTMSGQEVTLSVEWDLLLVLKSSHGTFGGKRLVLVHPLPAKTEVFIYAENTPTATDELSASGSVGNELVVTVEPPFLEDELADEPADTVLDSSDGSMVASTDYRTAATLLKRSRSRTFTIKVHGGHEALLSARDTLVKCRTAALAKMMQPPQGPHGASPS